MVIPTELNRARRAFDRAQQFYNAALLVEREADQDRLVALDALTAGTDEGPSPAEFERLADARRRASERVTDAGAALARARERLADAERVEAERVADRERRRVEALGRVATERAAKVDALMADLARAAEEAFAAVAAFHAAAPASPAWPTLATSQGELDGALRRALGRHAAMGFTNPTASAYERGRAPTFAEAVAETVVMYAQTPEPKRRATDAPPAAA